MAYPKYMRAAILVEQKKPLVIDTVKLPETLDLGQVLVKIHYSGICGSQIGEINGVKGPDRFLPHLLGHEGTGTVIEIGPGVEHVSVDDLVVLHWRPGLGMQGKPPKYEWKGKSVNAGWVTTFNEYAVVSENRLTTIPVDSDKQVGALFGCAVTTGFGVVVNNANVKIGESVVVLGAGGVGLNIVQAASLSGAYPIIAVDLFDGRLDLAKEMGATHTINSKHTNARTAISEFLAGTPLDVFIDNTGNPDIIEMGYDLTHSKGKVVLVGVPQAGKNVSLYSLPLHFGKSILGSHGGETIPEQDIPRYERLYRNSRINLKNIISNRAPLSDINDVISQLQDGTISGRVLIDFEE